MDAALESAPLARAKLVTIVAEAVLQDRLARLVREAGASGHTVSACAGEGSRGLRSTTPAGGQNVRIEAVVDDAAAQRILARLAAEYFPHYAVVAWLADVEVVRGAKFAGPAVR